MPKAKLAVYIIIVLASIASCTIILGPPSKFGFGEWPEHKCDNLDCME